MTKIQEIAQWLLDNSEFLDSLLFEAVSLSRRLAHLEYGNKFVSGMDAKFYVDFLSPIAEDTDEFHSFEKVILEFDITRHNPIHLQYETTQMLVENPKTDVERVKLLDWMDCCHMEGSSYSDLEAIRWILIDRLSTLARGEQITNYGILNTSVEEQLKIIKEIQKKIN